MSGSNRGRNYTLGFLAGTILAGIVGFLFWSDATNLEEQIRLQAQEHAEQYADTARISIECEPSDVIPSSENNCIDAESEAAREAQRSEYDLEAQQIMANWTRVMGKAAIVGMGVGILGLFLIFVTFWETRKAASAARDNLNAFYASERAILHVESGFDGTRTITGEPIIGFYFQNKGKSPARIIEAGGPSPDGDDTPNFAPRWTVVAPGKSAPLPGFCPPEKNQILSGTFWVKYTSVGPVVYQTYFEVSVQWTEASQLTSEGWKVDVSNTDGHPSDT